MAQFDIPRFLKTSPLVKGFKAPLPNAEALARAVAEYEADERAGFHREDKREGFLEAE